MASPQLFTDRITQILGNALGLNGNQRTAVEGFDISRFKGEMSQRGILPTNLFLVTIVPLSSLSAQSFNENGFGYRNSLTFFCHKTDLPGIDLAIAENRPYGTGPIERYPHNAIFGDIELQFIADSGGNILSLFHNWFDKIVPYNDTKENNENFYKVSYKNEYACLIEISVFNSHSDKVLKYTLYDAFPYRLNQTLMEWSPNNSFMNIGVNFFYKTFKTDKLSPILTTETQGLSFVQNLIKAGTIAQTISALKKPQSIGDIINLVNNANIVMGGISEFF